MTSLDERIDVPGAIGCLVILGFLTAFWVLATIALVAVIT